MDIAVHVGGAAAKELIEEYGRFAALCNVDAEQHIGYVGVEPDAVTTELLELGDGCVFAAARDGGTLHGLVAAEWDVEVGRTWVYGPWAADGDLKDRLYDAVLPHLPPGVGEHELFCDARNTALADFADRHGFTVRGQHAILGFPRGRLGGLPDVTLVPAPAELHPQLAALHDSTFPNTYLPSTQLLSGNAPIYVEADGGTLLGYVVLKLNPDMHDAQIQYVAVAEAARGRGVGARLVTGALRIALADGAYPRMDLVTNNPVARRLYERVGFELGREMLSFRTPK